MARESKARGVNAPLVFWIADIEPILFSICKASRNSFSPPLIFFYVCIFYYFRMLVGLWEVNFWIRSKELKRGMLWEYSRFNCENFAFFKNFILLPGKGTGIQYKRWFCEKHFYHFHSEHLRIYFVFFPNLVSYYKSEIQKKGMFRGKSRMKFPNSFSLVSRVLLLILIYILKIVNIYRFVLVKKICLLLCISLLLLRCGFY